MSFIVQQSPTAEADLERLFDFLLDWAETTEDLDQAQRYMRLPVFRRSWCWRCGINARRTITDLCGELLRPTWA